MPLAVPLLAQQSTGAIPYADGMENRWLCAQVSDAALSLDSEYVRIDAEGRVVVDARGAPFRCRAPASIQAGGQGGFPFPVLLGVAGLGGLVAALASDSGSDSPG